MTTDKQALREEISQQLIHVAFGILRIGEKFNKSLHCV